MMTPKQYLSRAILLDEKIEANLEALENLKSRVYNVNSKFSDDVRVQSSNSCDFTNAIDNLIEMEKKINKLVDKYVDLKNIITLEINSLENSTYSLLLIKRYVLNKNLYDIADEMFYSYGRIRHMHGEALEEFRKVYPDKFM